jgi:hypothetical protein
MYTCPALPRFCNHGSYETPNTILEDVNLYSRLDPAALK